MIYLCTLGRSTSVGILAVWCLFFLPTLTTAQGNTSPFCTPAALDVRPAFYNGPGDYFMVALNLRNISELACVPDLPLYVPQFSATETPAPRPFGFCDDCEDHLPNGQIRWNPPLLLNPGETAHQTFRWKTAPPFAGRECQQLSALGGPELLIVAPTVLKQVCSDIEVSRYYPGVFPGFRTADDRTSAFGSDIQAFVISSSKASYDDGEMFFLHVSLLLPGVGSPTDGACPTLFLRVRGADGATRFDETRPAAFRGCKWFIPGAKRDLDWQSGFDVDSGVGSRWGGIGQHCIELFETVGSPNGAQVQFSRSNELKVQIQDSSLISRRWRSKVKGVAADVTLDKDTYQVGEDVPLHIAIENFDAAVPIYAVDALWDSCSAVGLQVWNAQGQVLPESQRSLRLSCMGHGRGPRLYPPGKLVPIEKSLQNEGWLPTQPGTYTIVVSWATLTGSNLNQKLDAPSWPDTEPYATVQAAATFRIVSRPFTDAR
jgi:hypothetical protein